MPIFYGTRILDPRLSAALDLIRYLAQPDYFRRTHVTVRGPYSRRMSQSFEDSLKIRFSEEQRSLRVVRVGTFFQSTQNTVILVCKIPGIESVWAKPDFGSEEITPHLTLYDGKSREFAYMLRRTAGNYNMKFATKISSIEVLESKRNPAEYLDTYFEDASRLYAGLFVRSVDFREIPSMHEFDRIHRIGRLCALIEKEYTKTIERRK